MKPQDFLQEQIIFGGYGLSLGRIPYILNQNPKDFAIALIKTLADKNIPKRKWIKKINKKLAKDIKKFTYNKETRSIEFKVLWQPASIKITAENNQNIGPIYQKFLKHADKEERSLRNLWYLNNYVRFNNALEFQ